MEYLSRNAILYDDNHKFIKKRNFSFQETPGMWIKLETYWLFSHDWQQCWTPVNQALNQSSSSWRASGRKSAASSFDARQESGFVNTVSWWQGSWSSSSSSGMKGGRGSPFVGDCPQGSNSWGGSSCSCNCWSDSRSWVVQSRMTRRALSLAILYGWILVDIVTVRILKY